MAEDLKWVSTTNMFVLSDDKVLVLKRGEKEVDFPGWYMLPGGKQESDETPLQTAIRETFEETGVNVVKPKLKVIATHDHSYRAKVYLVYIFSADKFSGELIQSREGEAMWMPLGELLNSSKLYPDLKRHIGMITSRLGDEVLFTYHRFDEDLNIVEEK